MPGWLAQGCGGLAEESPLARTPRRRLDVGAGVWPKQPVMERANFVFRMEEWGWLQTQEDDSWGK